MWQALLHAGKSAITSLIPSAINWGVNKLVTSNLGKQYIVPALANNSSVFMPQRMLQAEKPMKYPHLASTHQKTPQVNEKQQENDWIDDKPMRKKERRSRKIRRK